MPPKKEAIMHDNISKTPGALPLNPRETVTDETLRMLAKGEPDWYRGQISDEYQALLAMLLPDICGELIARRAEETATRPRPSYQHRTTTGPASKRLWPSCQSSAPKCSCWRSKKCARQTAYGPSQRMAAVTIPCSMKFHCTAFPL